MQTAPGYNSVGYGTKFETNISEVEQTIRSCFEKKSAKTKKNSKKNPITTIICRIFCRIFFQFCKKIRQKLWLKKIPLNSKFQCRMPDAGKTKLPY